MVSVGLGIMVDITLQKFGQHYRQAETPEGREAVDQYAEDFLVDICSKNPEILYIEEWKFYLKEREREYTPLLELV